MNKLLVVCLYCILLRATTAQRFFPCGQNAIWQQCSNPCRPTCQNSYVAGCNINICRPGCVCRPGFIMNEVAGICVRPQHCHDRDTDPRCDRNEVWRECAQNHCRETCQRRKPKICTKKCTPGCSCRNGFVWDEHLEKCVLKACCSRVCGKNEDWCPILPDYIPTCQGIFETKCGSRNERRPGCICIKGFIWDELSRECIRVEDCLNVTSSTSESSSSSDTTTTETSSTSSVSDSTTERTTTTTDTTSTSTTTKSTTESTSSSDSTTTESTSTTTEGTTTAATTVTKPEVRIGNIKRDFTRSNYRCLSAICDKIKDLG